MLFGRSRAFWSSGHGPRLSNCEDIARGNGSDVEDDPVFTESLSSGVVVEKSAKDGV
jgi:hypothetical protein